MLKVYMASTKVFLLLALFSFACTPEINQKQSDYQWIFSRVLHRLEIDKRIVKQWRLLGRQGRIQLSYRYADIITNVSDIYRIDFRKFTRLGEIESDYRYWLTNSYGACGTWQIVERLHIGRIYKIRNGKVGIYLHKLRRKGVKINHREYLLGICNNAHLAGSLWRDWLDANNQDYTLMLLCYMAGAYSDEMKTYKNNTNVLYSDDKFFKKICYVLQI